MLPVLAAMILAVPPQPPSAAYVQIKNQGVALGAARTINCSGGGLTCTNNTTTGEATFTVTASGDGGSGSSVAIPNCDAGYVVDADGGQLYCTNVIATASALAADPTDCGANTYATAIAASGNLTCSSVADTGLANAYSGVGACSASHWASTLTRNSAPTCTQPAFSDISGTATDSQLASAYSGVGACGSHQWASTLARNAAPTCTQPNYTDLAGCEPGQGVSGAIQYNTASCEGGLSNFIGDGTNSIYLSQAPPAAPSAGSVAFDCNKLLFPMPMRKDAFFGIPIPQGFLLGPGLAQLGTLANWYSCSNYPGQWNSTSFDTAVGCLPSILAAEGTGASGGGWSTSASGRIRKVGFSQTTGQAWGGIHRGNLDDGEWTGNAAGVGGFVMWTRFYGTTHQTGDMTFAGVAATASAFTNGSKPSQQKNTAYVGCDSSDTNLQVCSNDNTTTSCITTSASFPCRTNGAAYDVWLAYPPNSALQDGGTGFNYYIERLDSAANISGTKSLNLPQNSVQMTPHVVFGSPDGGTLTVKPEISGLETWSNW